MKGGVFLDVNMLVHCWLVKRKHSGLAQLTEVDNLCVVNEQLFEEYDSFKCSYNNKTHLEMLLPCNDLVLHYMENRIQIRNVEGLSGIYCHH